MFKVKYYQHTRNYYESFSIHGGEVHLTQSASFANYLRKICQIDDQVFGYKSFVEKIFPNWTDPHTEIYLLSAIRDFILSEAPAKNKSTFEKRTRDFYLAVRFALEMGVTKLFEVPLLSLSEEQKFLISLLNHITNDEVVISYLQERATLTKEKIAERLNLKEVHTIVVHHFDYIDAQRMMMFYLLHQIGLEVIFHIPFHPNAQGVYKTWKEIYQRVANCEYKNWECVESSYPTKGAKFAQYLDDSFPSMTDPLQGIQFYSFEHPTSFKEYVKQYPIKENENEIIASYEEDLNLYTDLVKSNHFFATPYGKFLLSLQNCQKTSEGIKITYDDYVNMMTSGWVRYGHINGTKVLTLLVDLRDYMDGVQNFPEIMERLHTLVELQEVSQVFDEEAKDQAGRNQLKKYLSNPFRSFPYVHQSRYDITIKQLIECTKDLARKVNRLLLAEGEKRNVKQYLRDLYTIYSTVSEEWNDQAKKTMEKLFSISLPDHWEFTKEEMYHLLTLYLGSNEEKEDEIILNFDQLVGKTLSGKNIHVTGLSFKTFPWSTPKIPILLTHTWLKECIKRAFIGVNQKTRLNALLVDYYSKNVTRHKALYTIYHLLAYGQGEITFSYIKDLHENDGPSIYFTILEDLYMENDHQLEIKEEFHWEEPSQQEEIDSVDALTEFPDLLWLDSDFCYRKFFLNAFIEHHPIYESDFHQQLAFSFIGKLLSEQGDGEELFKETIFPLFPQWTNAHKQNLLDKNIVFGLRTYKTYENIYYPKAMNRLQILASKYIVTKKWKAKHQYENETFKMEDHIKEFLKNTGDFEVQATSGQHCRMCPYLHVCKDGEYAIDASD